jgi:hypothetical protein
MALRYMVINPDGLNAVLAYREFGDMNLHSTISSLRNGHGANFIGAYPRYDRRGRPKQYFILPLGMSRARRMLIEARPALKLIPVEGGASIGEV